ncbi:MAG: tetratricopeptide repeat protein [Bacteroidales bacterium]|nr:tetratricopeptide repeat protein [Bacteroidales bacterium]MCF8390399.1 tetratricopeptide repeat protein [Bacteroidales bacterium]
MKIGLKSYIYRISLILFLFPVEVSIAQINFLSTGKHYIDSLFSILPPDANNPGNDLQRIKDVCKDFNNNDQIKILTNIGNYYIKSELNDSARLYYSKSLELSKSSKNEYLRTISLMSLARIHTVYAEYDLALSKLNQALPYIIESDSSELNSNFYRIYGNVYWGMEIYDFALENYYISLEIAEKNNLIQNKASVYNNIGLIYFSIKDYVNAQKYFELAFNTAKASDFKWVMAICSNNLGTIYNELGTYDTALHYFKISRITAQELGGRLHEGITVFNMGETYLRLDSFALARKYLTESYEIAFETEDKIGIANALLKLSDLEIKSGNLTQAKSYLDSGLALILSIGSIRLQQDAYKIKYDYFKKANNPDSIVFSLQKLLFLKDTLAEIENIENISRLEYKYKEKVASQEIAILQREKRINHILIFTGSLAFVLILIMLTIFLLNSKKRYRELNRINNLIEEQQELLKQKNTELIIYQDKLEKMVYGKDKFITIMSHDLKNPVGAVRGFLELILNDYDKIQEKRKIVYLKEIFKSVETISLLIDNVLYWINSQNKGVESKPVLINIFERIAENISLYKIMANWKKIKINNETLEEHFILADKNIFDTIIRNLLSNSLKFTSEGGEITIRSTRKDQFIIIEIEDTGKGISEREIAEILNTSINQSTEGTSHEKGTGLGIGLVKEFANLMGASFNINSNEGVGSVFTLKFQATEK